MAPHLVAFYDTLGIRRTYSRLKPPASPRGQYEYVKIKHITVEMIWGEGLQWFFSTIADLPGGGGGLQYNTGKNR